jgi:23S rRNA pseudouridine2605 synthase
VLSRAGIASRRACEELIVAGRVTVDGVRATLGQRIDPATARVEVDGALVPVAPDLVYYLLNKPDDVITTADDPQGRATVLTLVPAEPRVFAVGRLDRHTEGLLIMTNDGALAQVLTHPSHGVAKEYVAEVEGGTPAPGALRALRQGVELDDGPTAPAEVGVLAPGVLRLVIHEGRNRQVRRMCQAVGHPVRRLVRTRIGPVRDTQLAPGRWRHLTADEVRALAAAAR